MCGTELCLTASVGCCGAELFFLSLVPATISCSKTEITFYVHMHTYVYIGSVDKYVHKCIVGISVESLREKDLLFMLKPF